MGLWVDKGTVTFAFGEIDLTAVDKRHNQRAYEAWVVPSKYLPASYLLLLYTSYRLCTATNCTLYIIRKLSVKSTLHVYLLMVGTREANAY